MLKGLPTRFYINPTKAREKELLLEKVERLSQFFQVTALKICYPIFKFFQGSANAVCLSLLNFWG